MRLYEKLRMNMFTDGLIYLDWWIHARASVYDTNEFTLFLDANGSV